MTSTESHWASMQPRVTTIGGDRLAYRVAGKGPLLVHGMAGSSLTWRHVMPALARPNTRPPWLAASDRLPMPAAVASGASSVPATGATLLMTKADG